MVRICAVLLAVPVLLAIAQPASAQMMLPPLYNPPTGYYYAPRVSYYYTPPVVSYYEPTTTYYSEPAVSYYAAPVTTYYTPAPVVTTYRYGLLGRRVISRSYYAP